MTILYCAKYFTTVKNINDKNCIDFFGIFQNNLNYLLNISEYIKYCLNYFSKT